MISMVLLVIDNPNNDPNSDLTRIIEYADIIVALVFTVEALCRIIALGFFKCSIPDKSGYITSGSNQIDFFVCISSNIVVMFSNMKLLGI
jgi:hypothetical protein